MGFIARRAGLGLLTLLAMSVVVFGLVRLQGDPLDVLLSTSSSTEEDRIALRRELGLDRPLPVQYLLFIGNAARGDFGESIHERRPVRDLVLERIPATATLALTALTFGLVIGVPLGVASAVNRGSWVDGVSRIFAMLGQSLPVFVSGLLFVWLFAVTLGWLPTSGRAGPQSYVLPSLAIGWFVASGIMRLVRSGMLDVLAQDYVRFARAKGLPERTVIWRHAFRNGLIPVLTFLGLVFAVLLTGSVVVENMFAWPGLGRLAITAVQGRDYPVVQAVVLLFTLGFVIVNLVVDVLIAYVDPRVRGG